MNNLYKNSILFVLIGIVFMACKNINNIIKPGDKPVIEAYLAPNHPVSMKVFTEIPYTETDSAYSKPITGLKIKISGSDGKSFLLSDNGEGNYSSKATDFIGGVGTTIDMSFTYNGRTVSASTIIPKKPVGFKMDQTEITRVARDFSAGPMQGGPGGGFVQETRVSINLNWLNPDNVYHFVAAQSLEANPAPIVVLPTNSNFNNRPPRRFNNQPIQTTANALQSQSFEYFGKYAVILYRLNPDYAALYVNNSTTSQNIATPISTISNGLGIFTGVNADTLILNVKKAQ